MIHIESRPCKIEKGRYEFYVDCKAETKEILMQAIEKLKEKALYLHILSKESLDNSPSETGNNNILK